MRIYTQRWETETLDGRLPPPENRTTPLIRAADTKGFFSPKEQNDPAVNLPPVSNLEVWGGSTQEWELIRTHPLGRAPRSRCVTGFLYSRTQTTGAIPKITPLRQV